MQTPGQSLGFEWDTLAKPVQTPGPSFGFEWDALGKPIDTLEQPIQTRSELGFSAGHARTTHANTRSELGFGVGHARTLGKPMQSPGLGFEWDTPNNPCKHQVRAWVLSGAP